MVVFIVLIIALIVLFALAGWAASSVASANQAQAMIEAARVSQIQATGSMVQSVNATLQTIGLLLVIVAAVVVVVYLLWRDRKREREFRIALLAASRGLPPPSGKWTPGPNARFQRVDTPQQLGAGGQPLDVEAILKYKLLSLMMRDNDNGSNRHDDDMFNW